MCLLKGYWCYLPRYAAILTSFCVCSSTSKDSSACVAPISTGVWSSDEGPYISNRSGTACCSPSPDVGDGSDRTPSSCLPLFFEVIQSRSSIHCCDGTGWLRVFQNKATKLDRSVSYASILSTCLLQRLQIYLECWLRPWLVLASTILLTLSAIFFFLMSV